MEDTMLKHLSICIALTAFGSGSLNAQQQAASLQKMQVPGADFELALAVPKYPAAAAHDLEKSPDALVLHLVGGELVLGFDSPEKMIAALETVRSPGCTLRVAGNGDKPAKPVAIFVVPKAD
jgi:hypothetical protein